MICWGLVWCLRFLIVLVLTFKRENCVKYRNFTFLMFKCCEKAQFLKVFSCFQEVQISNTGLQWVNYSWLVGLSPPNYAKCFRKILPMAISISWPGFISRWECTLPCVLILMMSPLSKLAEYCTLKQKTLNFSRI